MEVAQVGVRTRARARALAMAAAASSGTAKRRKISGEEVKFSSSLVQLRSRRSAAPAKSENSASDDRCSSRSTDHVPVSCCSSNTSSDLGKEKFEIVDLEDESVQIGTPTCTFGDRERREKTPSREMQSESGDPESTARSSEVNSCRKSPVEKQPTAMELEEFFSAAEKDRQKQFAEKYNFDIVKDAPMEGRYEWVRLKP